MMAALLFCQFALAEAPDASGDPAVTLVYAEVNNLDDTVVGQVALHFAERVNELTGGTVTTTGSTYGLRSSTAIT